MQDATSTLVDAIGSKGQAPTFSLTVDFDRSGTPTDITSYAGDITVTMALTTDEPDGVRLVDGYGVGTLDTPLVGDKTNNDHDGAWTWSPTNTDSPFYGKKRMGSPTVIEVGYTTSAGDETLPQFTGYVRELDTDSLARTATLQAYDGSDRLFAKVLLPMYTNLGHPNLSGRTFIDYVLTANGLDPDDQDLEDSLNPLTSTPYTGQKQDSWQLIQAIANAESACAFFDETGKFHFWNRHHFTQQTVDYDAMTVTVNGVTSPIPEITTARALTFSTKETVDSIRNHVIVTYTPMMIQPGDWIWQTGAVRKVPARGSVTLWPTFDAPIQSLGTDVEVIPIGGDTGGKSGYRACTTEDGRGEPVENLTFVITEFAQHAKVVISNPNAHTVYLVEPRYNSLGHLYPGWDPDNPKPMLWLWGRRVVSNPAYTSTTDGATTATVEASNAASMNADTGFGEQLLELGLGDGWIQDPDAALTYAQDMCKVSKRPYPFLGDIDVIYDPRLQPGDRIALKDNTGTKFDEHVWIVGMVKRYSLTGCKQTLTLRMCNAIGGWVLGHPTRSDLGSTTVLGGVY